METDGLYTWIEKQFYRDNHKKYHKYLSEWSKNLTETQLQYFEKQRINILTEAMIAH